MPLSHAKRLAEHRDRPGHAYPPDEGHSPRRQRQPSYRHHEARRQLLQPQAPPVLRRRQASESRVDMLSVDRFLQPRQLPTQVARPPEASLQQRLLEPAVEVLHAPVELRLPFGNEHRADAEPQAEPDHPRQRARRRPPAGRLAGVVELDLRRPSQVLPALPEEPEDLVHAPRAGQAQADGAIEGILADPDVVAMAAALEVDRPDQIDLVEFVGGAGLRAGVLLAGQQRGEPDPRRGQAVALERALDGARVGKRADVEGLEFGQDGRGPDEAVASSWRGVGLQPAADGEDRPLQLGRDALGDVVGGVGQVVQALGAQLEVAAPPLVEPELGAAEGLANGLDRSAAEAERDGTLACRKFVAHGDLRGAAAGGCPRRSL
jgi:hypothetical protein